VSTPCAHPAGKRAIRFEQARGIARCAPSELRDLVQAPTLTRIASPQQREPLGLQVQQETGIAGEDFLSVPLRDIQLPDRLQHTR
jgi:hypothetical protein